MLPYRFLPSNYFFSFSASFSWLPKQTIMAFSKQLISFVFWSPCNLKMHKRSAGSSQATINSLLLLFVSPSPAQILSLICMCRSSTEINGECYRKKVIKGRKVSPNEQPWSLWQLPLAKATLQRAPHTKLSARHDQLGNTGISTLSTDKNSAFFHSSPSKDGTQVCHFAQARDDFLIPGWAEGVTSLEWPSGVEGHSQEQERPSRQSVSEQNTVEKQL